MSTDLTTADQAAPTPTWRELLAMDDEAARNDRCRVYLARLRWPDGVRCPRCDSSHVAPVRSRNQIDCRSCRYRFSVTSGTFFHDSAVPVWKWLVAVSLLVESDDGFPAHRLAGAIGVSYKTAWSLGHRIRAALDGTSNPEGTLVEDQRRFEAGPNGSPRLFNRAIAGRYHQVSLKYLPAYRAEREWRDRNRANPDAFRDAVLALLRPDPARAPRPARTA